MVVGKSNGESGRWAVFGFSVARTRLREAPAWAKPLRETLSRTARGPLVAVQLPFFL